MTLRPKAASSYRRVLPLARLYLDDLDCIVKILKEAGEVEIMVGKDDPFGKRANIADSVFDLENVRPRHLRHLSICANLTGGGSTSDMIFLKTELVVCVAPYQCGVV